MTTKSTSPSSEDSEERAAGFVLFRSDGEDEPSFLVLRHEHGGHWGFPKGRCEPGEDDRAAAERELLEETGIGIDASIPGFHLTSRYRFVREGKTIDKRVVYFLARAEEGPVQLSAEHTDFAWLRYSEAVDRLTHAETRRVLAAAEEFLLASSCARRK